MSESGLKLIPQRLQNPKGFAAYYKDNRSGVGFMRNSVHPWAQGIGNTVPMWNDWGSSQWLLRFVSSNEQDACCLQHCLEGIGPLAKGNHYEILWDLETLIYVNRKQFQKCLFCAGRWAWFICEADVLNVLRNDYFQEKWAWLAVCMNSERKTFQ